MRLKKIKDYIVKTENSDDFIRDEMRNFKKSLPEFAEIVITERDEVRL